MVPHVNKVVHFRAMVGLDLGAGRDLEIERVEKNITHQNTLGGA